MRRLRTSLSKPAAAMGRSEENSLRILDILELARRAYLALPEIALQGIDIIREAGSGKLYLLEANPGGNTWIFSKAKCPKD